MRWMRRGARVALGGALMLALLPGCRTPGSFREPIARYQEGTARASTALGKYYSEMNRFERNLYLDERLYDPGLEVFATEGQNQPTPLLGKVFSPESIQARMDAMALLSFYAQRLAEVAGSEKYAAVPEGAKAMGERLGGLGQTLSELARRGDQTASRYVGPVGALVGVVGSLYLESHQAKALQVGIEQGAAQVRALIELLEADMLDIFGPQRLTGLKQALATRVVYYNLHRGKLSLSDRRAVLEDIRRAAEDYEALVVANPADIPRALRDAHEALLVFARSERKPETFEEFSAAMEAFRGRAEVAAAAVQGIRQPPEGGK